jgi:hypothetical protein
MEYPGVAESIASIERVAKKKEEKCECDSTENLRKVLVGGTYEGNVYETWCASCVEEGEEMAREEDEEDEESEKPKCDYCDKDGIYPQCRGRFVTCEEHILLPSKEEEGKDYHAHDRFLYALEAQWKTMSCAGELNEDGIDLRDVPYLALTEKLSEVATPTEMDELDGWGDDPMSFYVMKCLADKYGLEYPKNPPSPPGRGESR